MSDVLKGFAGNLAYLTAWMLPAAAGVGIVALVVFPNLDSLGLARMLNSLGGVTTASILVGASLALGIMLNTASVPLYRFFEGYSRLYPFRDRRRNRMLYKRQRLLTAYQLARTQDAGGYAANLALEAARLYPAAENEVLPTRMGNAIRSFETYAWRQYQMDSQTLWPPLWAVVPQQLRDEYDRARASVDFCLASIVTLILFVATTVALCVAAWAVDGRLQLNLLLAGSLAPLVMMVVMYRVAITGCLTWGIATKGIVEAGRVSLAALLGLRLPPTLKEEREMWRVVSRFARESRPDADWAGADNFDHWRVSPSATPSA